MGLIVCSLFLVRISHYTDCLKAMQCVSVYNIWFEGEENRCSLFSKLQEKGTYIRTILFKVTRGWAHVIHVQQNL